jgi:hypothetical protein
MRRSQFGRNKSPVKTNSKAEEINHLSPASCPWQYWSFFPHKKLPNNSLKIYKLGEGN